MSIVRKTEPTLQCGRNHLVKFGPLHPATKLLLQRFFAPWNDELRRLLEAKGVATVPGYGFTPGEENKERSDVAIYERFSCELFLNYRRKKIGSVATVQHFCIFALQFHAFLFDFFPFFTSSTFFLPLFLNQMPTQSCPQRAQSAKERPCNRESRAPSRPQRRRPKTP